jgi:DNA polymerase-3 subunit alpha
VPSSDDSFVHLHVHSEYSLTDSTIRVADLVAACAQAVKPPVALTDQCNQLGLGKL